MPKKVKRSKKRPQAQPTFAFAQVLAKLELRPRQKSPLWWPGKDRLAIISHYRGLLTGWVAWNPEADPLPFDDNAIRLAKDQRFLATAADLAAQWSDLYEDVNWSFHLAIQDASGLAILTRFGLPAVEPTR